MERALGLPAEEDLFHKSLAASAKRMESAFRSPPGLDLSHPRDRQPSPLACYEAPEPEALLRAVAEELAARPTRYFTGHCTGERGFALLREELGAQVTQFSTGLVVEL